MWNTKGGRIISACAPGHKKTKCVFWEELNEGIIWGHSVYSDENGKGEQSEHNSFYPLV